MPDKEPIQRSKYTLSKMSIAACIVIVVGSVILIQGMVNRYHLAHIKSSYLGSEIKNGHYIEYDISREQLVGKNYTEPNGKVKYGPYSVIDVYSKAQTCLVAINDSVDYYVSLIIPSEYQEDFEKMVQSETDTYHVFGKFKKKNQYLYYDTIAECLGINDESEIKRMVSDNCQITVVDPDDEKSTLYKGLSLLALGLFVLFVTVEKDKRIPDEEQNLMQKS